VRKTTPWVIAGVATVAFAFYQHEWDPWLAGQHRLGRLVATDLSAATEVEIYSLSELHPSGNTNAGGASRPKFLKSGYPVKGSAIITAAEVRELATAIESGLAGGHREVPKCFDPHHALRLMVNGNDEYVVVCFICGQGFVDRGNGEIWFSIGSGEKGTWDQVLKAHRIIAGLNSKANQSPEPVPAAVTPPARQESRHA
jgi:hypothetical protein